MKKGRAEGMIIIKLKLQEYNNRKIVEKDISKK